MRDENFSPDMRPLTAVEAAEMRAVFARAEAHNRLLGVVETWGLLQYLLLPGLMVMVGLAAWRRNRRWLGHVPVPAIVAVGAFILLWHRAYFTSLGW